jgi:hypothetical protein
VSKRHVSGFPLAELHPLTSLAKRSPIKSCIGKEKKQNIVNLSDRILFFIFLMKKEPVEASRGPSFISFSNTFNTSHQNLAYIKLKCLEIMVLCHRSGLRKGEISAKILRMLKAF